MPRKTRGLGRARQRAMTANQHVNGHNNTPQSYAHVAPCQHGARAFGLLRQLGFRIFFFDSNDSQ